MKKKELQLETSLGQIIQIGKLTKMKINNDIATIDGDGFSFAIYVSKLNELKAKNKRVVSLK